MLRKPIFLWNWWFLSLSDRIKRHFIQYHKANTHFWLRIFPCIKLYVIIKGIACELLKNVVKSVFIYRKNKKIKVIRRKERNRSAVIQIAYIRSKVECYNSISNSTYHTHNNSHQNL